MPEIDLYANFNARHYANIYLFRYIIEYLYQFIIGTLFIYTGTVKDMGSIERAKN